MKKFVIGVLLAVVLVVAAGVTGYVYAQGPANGGGGGMMGGGRGMMGAGSGLGQSAAAGTQTGLLHDEMVAAFAVELGLSVDDLNARLANGETMSQIAIAEGYTLEEFRTMMLDVRTQVIDQAVKDGTLTQAQADWMKQHGAGMMAGSGYGMRGNGTGRNAASGCPYAVPAQP